MAAVCVGLHSISVMNYISSVPAKVLLLLGVVNMFTAIVSSCLNVEKTGFIPAYINTHWITTIMLFAALAHIHLIHGDYFSEVFCFVLNVFSAAVCGAAVIADAANIPMVREALNGAALEALRNISRINSPAFAVKLPIERSHLIYSAIDGLTALAAIPLSLIILSGLMRSNHHLPRQATNAPILGLGTALVVLGVTRGVIYLNEILTLRQQPLAATGFVNYTLDESAWITVTIATGVITVLASRGSSLFRGVSIVSCSTLLWPAMFYMWCDYRALEAGLGKPSSNRFMLILGIVLVTAEVGVLVATALTLLSQYSTSTKIKLEESVRRVFYSFAMILLALAVATLFLDLYTSLRQIFYRVFHGNEQKLPFLSALLGLFCYLAPVSSLGSVTLPLCMTVALLTASSTFFQLLAYVWLSWRSYLPDQICPMLQAKGCPDPITLEGTRIHFIEALLNFSVLVISTLVCFLVFRISRMRVNQLDVQLSGADRRQRRSIERKILAMGVVMEVGALALFVGMLTGESSTVGHPLIVMYGYLYHIALAIGLIIFPLYQIICSEGLREQPIALSTLISLCTVRFVAIFSQLDYRSTGESMDREWRIHHLIDMIAMFCCFYTIILLFRLRLIGKCTLGSEHTPMEFNNPLEEDGREDDGYIQLRPELNI